MATLIHAGEAVTLPDGTTVSVEKQNAPRSKNTELFSRTIQAG